MIKNKKKLYSCFLGILTFAWCTAYGMTFDNRYLPLYLKPFVRRPCTFGHFQVQSLFMRSDIATGDFDESSIPDIDGKYDQVEIGKALVQSGSVGRNLFRSDLRGLASIAWRREGSIGAEGLAFFYEHYLPSTYGFNWSLGTSFLFMHINSEHEFCLDNSCIELLQSDRQYLLNLKQDMHSCLGFVPKMQERVGVVPPLYKRTAFGDLDLYLRFGRGFEYFCKCRRIDTGLRVGMIAPTATKTPINNPAAISLGGNDHWGIYTAWDTMIELKEDWFVGVLVRANKRFKKTHTSLMPVALEPSRYGAIAGLLEVNPGWTFAFNPVFRFEGLRYGLGLTALYTLVAHLEDKLADRRSDKTIPVNLAPVERRSSWGMEHVSIGAFYDFSCYRQNHRFAPTISLYWDIPVHWLVSKRANRTHNVSIMIEADF